MMNSQSQGGVAARLQAQGLLDEAMLVAAKHHAQQQGLSLGIAAVSEAGGFGVVQPVSWLSVYGNR